MKHASQFLEDVAAVLECVGGRLTLGTDAALVLDCRTIEGFGHSVQWVAPPFERVPPGALALLTDGYELRLSPALWRSAAPDRSSLLVVRWRPEAEHHVQWSVTPAGQAHVAAQLARMPAPTVLVDGGAEVWAGWRLLEALPAAALLATMRTVAAALEAEIPDALETFTVPLAGPVRNWTVLNPDRIAIEHVDPTRRYALTDLLPQEIENHEHRRHSAHPVPGRALRTRQAELGRA